MTFIEVFISLVKNGLKGYFKLKVKVKGQKSFGRIFIDYPGGGGGGGRVLLGILDGGVLPGSQIMTP